MTIRKSIFLITVNLAVLGGSILLLELGMHLFIDTYNDHKSFRLSQPQPYQDAPYFSVDFINESFEQPGGWTVPPGTNLLLPNDYKGKYFNVDDGIRRTTHNPPDPTRQVYLFGGSTVYASEVPDDHTIASHLQRLLMRYGYPSYRVVNLGVTSVNTIQQVERLLLTEISADDIVIFYDGVNEVVQGVLYGNAGDTIFEKDRSRPFWEKLFYRISNRSALVRHALAESTRNYQIRDLELRVDRIVTQYRKKIDEAETHVRAQGANFLHFLQPSIFSRAALNDYEQDLLKLELIPIQAENAFRSSYSLLAGVVKNRAEQGYADFDLSAVFDGLQKSVYLDFCHVNHVGNEIIANAMMGALISTGSIKRKNAGES